LCVDKIPIHPKLRAVSDREVKIGSPLLDHLLQKRAEAQLLRGLGRGLRWVLVFHGWSRTPVKLGQRPSMGCSDFRSRSFPRFPLVRARPQEMAEVSFITSSRVVTPLSSFLRPSIRNVSIPSATAASRSSSAVASCIMSFRIPAFMAMTS